MSETKQTSQTPCRGPSPDGSSEAEGGGCCAPAASGGFKFWYLGVIILAIGVAIAALMS